MWRIVQYTRTKLALFTIILTLRHKNFWRDATQRNTTSRLSHSNTTTRQATQHENTSDQFFNDFWLSYWNLLSTFLQESTTELGESIAESFQRCRHNSLNSDLRSESGGTTSHEDDFCPNLEHWRSVFTDWIQVKNIFASVCTEHTQVFLLRTILQDHLFMFSADTYFSQITWGKNSVGTRSFDLETEIYVHRSKNFHWSRVLIEIPAEFVIFFSRKIPKWIQKLILKRKRRKSEEQDLRTKPGNYLELHREVVTTTAAAGSSNAQHNFQYRVKIYHKAPDQLDEDSASTASDWSSSEPKHMNLRDHGIHTCVNCRIVSPPNHPDQPWPRVLGLYREDRNSEEDLRTQTGDILKFQWMPLEPVDVDYLCHIQIVSRPTRANQTNSDLRTAASDTTDSEPQDDTEDGNWHSTDQRELHTASSDTNWPARFHSQR